jgi:hypothetical protein
MRNSPNEVGLCSGAPGAAKGLSGRPRSGERSRSHRETKSPENGKKKKKKKKKKKNPGSED